MVQPQLDEPKLEPKMVEESIPEPEPDPDCRSPEPEPVDRTEDARKKASVAGLLPFADDLAELRDNQAIASVTADRQLAGAAGEAAQNVERSLITSKAGKSSGGINTAGMSRNTGGAGLAGHNNTTAVSSTVAGLGDGARRAASTQAG